MLKIEAGNKKEYKVEAIQNSTVYAQKSKQTPTRAILFNCMERLFKKKKYPKTILGSYAPPKNGQYLLQGPSGKANSNIFIFELCSSYDKANSQACREAETKKPSKKRYEIH